MQWNFKSSPFPPQDNVRPPKGPAESCSFQEKEKTKKECLVSITIKGLWMLNQRESNKIHGKATSSNVKRPKRRQEVCNNAEEEPKG